MQMNWFAFFPGLYKEMGPNKIGFFVNPAATKQYTQLGGQGISVVAYSERKDDALQYLKWFAQPDVQKKWWALGGYSCLKAVLDDPGFTKSAPFAGDFLVSMNMVKDFWASRSTRRCCSTCKSASTITWSPTRARRSRRSTASSRTGRGLQGRGQVLLNDESEWGGRLAAAPLPARSAGHGGFDERQSRNGLHRCRACVDKAARRRDHGSRPDDRRRRSRIQPDPRARGVARHPGRHRGA
jgi:hypothetical protein